ncbi:hypothetical protein F503_04164 [Ophiostoma piceae UAMH 11346]|uniref:Uncharacterized protein n=1 Tax=Ophiostoma piceae (strain UAMH 11346) TaxID=1262450 RepID=S3C6Z7_OPHP1|nr:hypothetical protein F503_04164 [Ophiostoma piceae UAMH 11346]
MHITFLRLSAFSPFECARRSPSLLGGRASVPSVWLDAIAVLAMDEVRSQTNTPEERRKKANRDGKGRKNRKWKPASTSLAQRSSHQASGLIRSRNPSAAASLGGLVHRDGVRGDRCVGGQPLSTASTCRNARHDTPKDGD